MKTLLWGLSVAAAFGAGWGLCARRYREREDLRARLLSFVGHELNNPILSLHLTVMNFLDGLFGPIPDQHRPWLVLIREQTARLSALVGDLRDLVHMEFHGDLRLSPEPVALDAAIRGALDTMQDAMTRSRTPLEIRTAEGLPPVQADPDRLLRILTAMLTHARKFRTRGTVFVRVESEPGGAAVSVEYEGMPAAAEDVAEALDLFYPAKHSDSQILASTGLGLGLSSALMRLHGGRMELGVDGVGRCRVAIHFPIGGKA